MTSKTEAAHEVRLVLEAVKNYLATPNAPKIIEAGTRAHFIDPLLRALGYGAIGDIRYEAYLPDPKQHVDYQLLIDGTPRVAVEAKAVDVPLSDQHSSQVVQYCAVLGTEWAVVTNAREWRLYNAFANGSLAAKHVLTVDMVDWQTDAQFDAVFDQLWLVSKDAFAASGGPAAWLVAKQLDGLLRAALTNPGAPEVKYLRKRLAEQGVVATAEEVAMWLKAHLDGSPAPARHAPAVAEGGTALLPPQPVTAAPTVKRFNPAAGGMSYWLIPAGPKAGMSAAQHLQLWLGKGFWGFWATTPGRKSVHVGDLVCFFAAKQHLVMAYARVAGEPTQPVGPDEWPEPNQPDHQLTYKVPLADITWLPTPVKVDGSLRATLDAFAGRDPNGNWAWLVQTTRRVSGADFLRLTGR